jgi:hypothetical protein
MLYCGMDKALRETAGVFTLLDERVTDTAIHKRLKACAPWVKALLKRLLPCEQSYPEASRIRVVDGSSLQGPGAKGTDFRLHLALDLTTLTLHEIQVTGFEQGEKLSRFRFAKGDIVIADRGYNHPGEILELAAQGISTVVRLLPTAMPLYHRQAEQELTAHKRLSDWIWQDTCNVLPAISSPYPCGCVPRTWQDKEAFMRCGFHLMPQRRHGDVVGNKHNAKAGHPVQIPYISLAG